MGKKLKRIMVLTAASVAVFHPHAAAAAQCPDLVPGAPYPWDVEGHFSGDQHAELSIDIDEKGKITACRVIKSNMSREDNFWTCGALQAQGKEKPEIRDGVPVKSTRTVQMTTIGMRHAQANATARKKWFKEHPEERWDCYPE
jgi:hypothetical protein